MLATIFKNLGKNGITEHLHKLNRNSISKNIIYFKIFKGKKFFGSNFDILDKEINEIKKVNSENKFKNNFLKKIAVKEKHFNKSVNADLDEITENINLIKKSKEFKRSDSENFFVLNEKPIENEEKNSEFHDKIFDDFKNNEINQKQKKNLETSSYSIISNINREKISEKNENSFEINIKNVDNIKEFDLFEKKKINTNKINKLSFFEKNKGKKPYKSFDDTIQFNKNLNPSINQKHIKNENAK